MALGKEFYYSIKSVVHKSPIKAYVVGKLDKDLRVVEQYYISPMPDNKFICNCPSWKQPCKHIKFLHMFRNAKWIDTDALWDQKRGEFTTAEEIV